MDRQQKNYHATALQWTGKGILLRGASGSGKSSIALRLLDAAANAGLPAFLVGDDRIGLSSQPDGVYAHAPEKLRGLIELRGLGIIAVETIAHTRLDLVVDLVPKAEFERYPHEGANTTLIEDTAVPRIAIVERNPDAAMIIRMFFRAKLVEPSVCI